MLRYPTPVEHSYGDAYQWTPAAAPASGAPPPAVTPDAEERPEAQSPLSPHSAYAYPYAAHGAHPAAPYDDSPYTPQGYPPPQTVNYALPPYDFAEYPTTPDACYPPSSGPSSSSAYLHGPYTHAGYYPTDAPRSPYDMPYPAEPGLPYDDTFEHYAAPPLAAGLLLSSGSSELGHALVETPSPAPRLALGPVKTEPAHEYDAPLSSPAYGAEDGHAHHAHAHPAPFRVVQDPSAYPAPKVQQAAARAPGQVFDAAGPKAGQGVLKLPSTKRAVRRKPAIACLFCRERKIACGAPPAGSADTTCNQCARRSRKCEYPTMSRRGLHKRQRGESAHARSEAEDADYVPTT